MSLVFYYAPMSTATPVHWALEELGIPYEKVRIDLQNGQQNEPSFRKLNPNGKVPTIVHDGVAIFESVAIQIHLGETFGVEKGLFPPPGLDRAQAIMWLVWCNVTLGDAMSRVFRNTSPYFPEAQRNAEAGAIAKTDLEGLLKLADTALHGKSYLVGDRFTLADLHLTSWLDYVGMSGIDLTPLETLHAWQARCRNRPAYTRVMSG